MTVYTVPVKFSDIYSKEELKKNNWNIAHVEISVRQYSGIDFFAVVEKLPIGLSAEEVESMAKQFVKDYFAKHPEYNYNDFQAIYSCGDSLHGTTGSISLYQLIKK